MSARVPWNSFLNQEEMTLVILELMLPWRCQIPRLPIHTRKNLLHIPGLSTTQPCSLTTIFIPSPLQQVQPVDKHSEPQILSLQILIWMGVNWRTVPSSNGIRLRFCATPTTRITPISLWGHVQVVLARQPQDTLQAMHIMRVIGCLRMILVSIMICIERAFSLLIYILLCSSRYGSACSAQMSSKLWRRNRLWWLSNAIHHLQPSRSLIRKWWVPMLIIEEFKHSNQMIKPGQSTSNLTISHLQV